MDLAILLLCFSALLLNIFVDCRIRVSDEKCDYYRRIIPSMPKEFNETADDAALNEFPFMAMIQNDTTYFNGILISENFVLSTAFLQSPTGFYVVLGDLEGDTNSDDEQMQKYDVIELIVHPDYNKDDRRHNIRLFRLSHSVQFNEYVQPACLSRYAFSISQNLIEIGWSGTTLRNSKRLHKIKLHYISSKSCKEAFNTKGKRKYIRGIDNGTIFCAGTNEGDRAMCAGFSGSAVINADRKAFNEIVGIASYGFVCKSGNPDVFVNVLAYSDWIESIVWPKESFLVKYALIIAAGVAFVLICILAICFVVTRSRDKRNLENTMNVHMNINH